MEHLDDLSLSKLMQGDSKYLCCSAPYRSQERQKALAERTMLTPFVGKQVYRKRLYESRLFFEPHLDAHTSREAEEKMAEHTSLEVEKLDENAVNCLKSTLPGITKLRIVIRENDNTDVPSQIMGSIIQLLEHWANKLDTLGIWDDFPFQTYLPGSEKYTTHLRPLFAFINEKLLSLQYFTMAVPRHLEKLPLDVSFIGRLKRFSTNIPTEQLIDSLNHHGALQEKLPEIRLFNGCALTEETASKLLEMPPHLALKITALNLLNQSKIKEPAFFAHFSALKWCIKCADSMDIPQVLNSLSVLQQLKYLLLGFTDPTESSTEKYNGTTSPPPLPLLETLVIKGVIHNQHFLSYFGLLERRFPSLKWLRIDIWLAWVIETPPKEIVSLCMHEFAQQQLIGSFKLSHGNPSSFYKEDFNFTEGRKFEDWQYKDSSSSSFGGDIE